MDFVERRFHFWPDGGDGTLEAACLAAVLVAVSATVIRFALRKLQRGVIAGDTENPVLRALCGRGLARVENDVRRELDDVRKGC